jgi:beta-N-acetylhexosaminidase
MHRLFFCFFIVPVLVCAQSQQHWVDSIYANMSLDQKIGQLFMVMAFPDGNDAKQQHTIYQLKKYQVGGLLFSKGTSNQQLQDTKRYQQLSEIPLMIAADAEWGMAMRLQDIEPYPYAMTLGALPNTDLIYALAKRLGDRKRLMGVHVSFAPVADINTESKNPIIGVRAYGDNPNRVAQQAQAFMEGLQDAGIWSVAKHFPGHGASKLDSHRQLPTINRAKQALDTIDLFPFRHLFLKGIKGVMVGHLDVPALDNSALPVSVSSKVVTQLLQNELGFDGLVFTDALDMKGVTTSVKSPALAAFLAGADVLVMPLDIEKAILNIKQSYYNGEISPKRLEHSVKKILQAKYIFSSHHRSKNQMIQKPLQNTYYDAYLRNQIAIQSIVKVHATQNQFPLSLSTNVNYVALGVPSSNVFLDALNDHTQTTEIPTHKIQVVEISARPIVVGVFANTASPWNCQSISVADKALLSDLSSYSNVHIVIFANPYVCAQIPNLSSFASVILAHEQQHEFANAAAKVLFGRIPAMGILPVHIK